MNFHRHTKWNLQQAFIAKIYIGITLLLLCLIPSLAQTKTLRFDNSILTMGNELSLLGGVNKVIQDTHGFIWMGGENGLARYDGKEFVLYQSGIAGLTSNYIWDLSLDQKGDLWIANSSGICRYQFTTGQFEPTLSWIPPGTVTTMLWDGKGQLYYGNHNGAVERIDFKTQTHTTLPLDWPASKDKANTIFDLKIDNQGAVWIASNRSGIAKFDPANNQVNYFYHQEGVANSLASNNIQVLHIDNQNRVWIGTFGNGVDILNPATGVVQALEFQTENYKQSRTAVVMDIYQHSNGEVWLAVDHYGLFQFSKELVLLDQHRHSISNQNSLLSDQTRTLFEDINHDLWVGVFPFGASVVNTTRANIETYQMDGESSQSLSSNAILAFLQDRNGLIWAGTENGLNVLNPQTGLFTRYMAEPENPDALASNAVLSLAEGNNGEIWVGTWSGGLHKFNPKTQKFKRYLSSENNPRAIGDNFIWSIMLDSDGTLWVTNEKTGLHQYQAATDDFIRYEHQDNNPDSISGNYILKIIEDKNKDLWLTSFYGLNRLDKKTGKFSHFYATPDDLTSLSSNSIKTLFADSKGYIWVGTHDGGVNRYDPRTNKFKRFGRAEGLPSLTVSAIVEDLQGDIWLTTTNGLARINPITLEISHYNIEDGLIGNTFNRDAALIDNTGKLYFGSTEGITAFRPEQMKAKASQHPTYITHFRIANREVLLKDEGSPLAQAIWATHSLDLPHDVNMFSFDFVTLNFRNPNLNQYKYQLEGFDPSWIELKERNTATYTNLNPGDYIFRVQAKAPGEDWQQSQQAISIHINAPIWKTPWAYGIYLISIILLLYGVFAIGQLKKTSDFYKARSLTDPLTQVYNRAGILQVVQVLFSNIESKTRVAVCLIDIDFFKRINDRRGHDAGDRVIVKIIEIIKQASRRGDYLGRWGGEEFILLCAGVTSASALDFAEKIRTEIATHIFEETDSPLKVTVSIGVAMAQPDLSFDEICKQADKSLYAAKAGGRNCVVNSWQSMSV